MWANHRGSRAPWVPERSHGGFQHGAETRHVCRRPSGSGAGTESGDRAGTGLEGGGRQGLWESSCGEAGGTLEAPVALGTSPVTGEGC